MKRKENIGNGPENTGKEKSITGQTGIFS